MRHVYENGGPVSVAPPPVEPVFALKLGSFSWFCMWQGAEAPVARVPTRDDEAQVEEKGFDPELKQFGGTVESKLCVGQVTIRLPFQWKLLPILALVYGFLPWIVPLSFVVFWIKTWHSIFLYAFGVSASTGLGNEVLLKPLFKEPRPNVSANRHADGSMKMGMPSGHAVNTATLLVWVVLEILMRGRQNHDGTVPLFNLMWLSFMILMLAPVPWARWYIGDHTFRQVAVGMLFGLMFGIFAFHIRQVLIPHAWEPWSNPEQT